MDYEKKYKQLHKFISDLYPFMSEYCKEKVEGFLPELKESEDEKVRKALVELVKCNERSGYTLLNNVSTSSMLDWLEKQGKETSEKEFTFKALPRLLEMIEVSDRAKAYTEKLAVALDNEGYHTDAKIVRESIKIMNGEEVPMATMDEQKPINKVQPKFKVGDWIVTDKNHIWLIDEDCSTTGYSYRLISQNGKVEVGDYNIVDEHARLWTIRDAKDGNVLREDSCTFIIERMNPDGTAIVYCCLFDDGDFDSGSTLSFDIDSTKPATKEQRDFFFQKMKEKSYEWNAEKKELKKIKYRVCDEDKAEMDYCFTKMMNGEKVSEEDEEYNGEYYGIDSLYHAQRILEKTLGSVDGYQTDDGILSHKCAITAIKKLYEQKSAAWSKEDGRMFDYALDMIEWYSGKNGDKSKLVSDWFKSLKDRVQPQNWTKEDKERYISCLQRLSTGNPEQPETINSKWFKEHVYPQKQWKPNKEQLHLLHWIANIKLGDSVVEQEVSKHLNKLYEDLKKLKEE